MMKTTMKRLATAAFATLVATSPALAQDKAKAAAAEKPKATADAKAAAGKGTTKTIVDNEKVVVTEVTYKPGEASDMRERGARVTRALSDGTMERVYPDGKKQTVHWKAGEVKYFPKETFQNKNVGKTDMVLFVTTVK
jgi:signal transduction protein with GAF and PtsI domain